MDNGLGVIALLGVGSTYFTRGILESLVRVGGAWDVRLGDIDPHALDVAERLCRRLAEAHGAPISVRASTDRREVLAGCGAVVSTIGVGGRPAWIRDVTDARRFDINQTTGDTFGYGGVSRALRMVPAMIGVARDMERLCPDALLVNFSNPMSVICRAITKATRVRTVGLCTGVKWFHRALADALGLPPREVWYEAAGVNHFTFITALTHRGEDLWPRVRALKDDALPGGPYTRELFRAFGAYPCVGDGHITEFVPGWAGTGCYYGKTLGVDACHDFERYAATYDEVQTRMEDEAYGRAPIATADLHADAKQFSDEHFFAELMLALRGDRELLCTINLPNRGQVANLPAGAILESTALVNGAGFKPFALGDLPAGIAAIMGRVIAAQDLCADAALAGDRRLAVQALIADLTARTQGDAEAMLDQMVSTHRAHLPESLAAGGHGPRALAAAG